MIFGEKNFYYEKNHFCGTCMCVCTWLYASVNAFHGDIVVRGIVWLASTKT